MTAIAEREAIVTPYPGLMPYGPELAAYFFGRDRERQVVAANLEASRVTLLYGESGVGKSSLLHAGVIPTLLDVEDEGPDRYVVVVCAAWRGDPTQSLATAVREAVQELDADGPRNSMGSLAETLAASAEARGGDVLVILDQFEELFRYHPRPVQMRFADELSRAVRDPDLRANFLLAIREDGLAHLDVFKGLIPGLFENRIRLRHLETDAAREAIVGPAERFAGETGTPVKVEQRLVDAVVKQITIGGLLLGGGTDETVDDEQTVKAPYLQLVMSRIWEHDGATTPIRLRRQTLDDLGGAKRIVQTHLDEALSALSFEERKIAAAIFYHLVTPSGSKVAHRISDLAAYARDDQNATIDHKLVPGVVGRLAGEARILRRVPARHDRERDEFVEIYHDALALAILDWRPRFLAAVREREIVTELTPGDVSFAELVSAHFEYEREVREAGLLRTETEVRYRQLLARFEALNGPLLEIYWSSASATAVALTARPAARFARLLRRHGEEVRFHSITETAVMEAPGVARLLRACETLALKATSLLRGLNRQLALQWILGIAAHALGTVDTKAAAADDPRLDVEALKQLKQAEAFVEVSAARSARVAYFQGAAEGLVVLALLLAIVTGVLALVGSVPSSFVDASAATLAGALGAWTSVTMRLSAVEPGSPMAEIGTRIGHILGGFRSLVGAVLGLTAYFAAAAALLPLPGGDGRRYALVSVAFVAGFAERWLGDVATRTSESDAILKSLHAELESTTTPSEPEHKEPTDEGGGPRPAD